MAGSDAATAREIAQRLLGASVHGLERVAGGRNSRVYRVEAETGMFALKHYPSRKDDARDRLGTEVTALRWMGDQGLSMVPRVHGVSCEANFVLLSWVEGARIEDVAESDIDLAADFLKRIHELRTTCALPFDRLASEACLSGREIERQIVERAAGLRSLPSEDGLHGFLDGRFAACLEPALEKARRRLNVAGAHFDTILPQAMRSPVPSDFGFHNALRQPDGTLVFLDFEYFGWDDPVKLTADILLHPGRRLALALRQRLRSRAERLYGDDPQFRPRLEAFYPLFGLRWVLILLNEFHPERWRRRVEAGAGEAWTDAKARQLASAERFLGELTEEGIIDGNADERNAAR